MIGYTEGQSKALAIIPKVTGSLSLLASAFIVQHVFRSPSMRRRPYHRLLLGMSLSDIVGSFFGCVLSTTPMPTDSSVYGASGSVEFCSAAGFFSQGGNVAAPLYNGSLATFYLLTIVYGWREARIATKVEPYFHLFPLLIGWGTATAAAFMNLYAPANWTCWIAPYPEGCKSTWRFGVEEANCERGNNAFVFRFLFKYVLIWIVIIYIIAVMIIIYRSVLSAERASKKYRHPLSGSAQSNRDTSDLEGGVVDEHRLQRYQQRNQSITRKREKRRQDKSKQIAHQALLYVGALLLTYFFSTIVRVIQFTYRRAGFGWMVMMTLFLPLQGFFNLIIYLRPRYIDFCKKKEDASWHRNLLQFCVATFCPECMTILLSSFIREANCSHQSKEDTNHERGRKASVEHDDAFADNDQEQSRRDDDTRVGHENGRRNTPEDLEFPRMSSLLQQSSIASELVTSFHHHANSGTRISFSSDVASRNQSLCSILSVQLPSGGNTKTSRPSTPQCTMTSQQVQFEVASDAYMGGNGLPVIRSLQEGIYINNDETEDDPGG